MFTDTGTFVKHQNAVISYISTESWRPASFLRHSIKTTNWDHALIGLPQVVHEDYIASLLRPLRNKDQFDLDHVWSYSWVNSKLYSDCQYNLLSFANTPGHGYMYMHCSCSAGKYNCAFHIYFPGTAKINYGFAQSWLGLYWIKNHTNKI